MNITLVNPPYVLTGTPSPKVSPQFLRRILGQTAPLGLLSVAAYVRAHIPEAAVRIVDGPGQQFTSQEVAERAVSQSPQILGISTTTAAVRAGEEIAREVKARVPGVLVVVGGPHVSGAGEAALKEVDAFDIGVTGEGEETFKEVVEAVLGGRPVESVAGIVYRDAEGRVRRTPDRKSMEDLDTIPLPAWDLLADFPRIYSSNIFFASHGPTGSLCTSRGCPFACAFCDQSTFGQRYRAFSPEYVAKAVQCLQERHGVRHVVFCDDTFTLDRGRVLRLCDLLRNLQRPITWTCDAHVMTIDRTLLQAMKRAGCWGISFGLESGSPRVLESLRKGIKLDRAAQAVRTTREEGIHAKGLFMAGTPEESLETTEQTRRFMTSIPLTSVNLSKYAPYPGTELRRAMEPLLQGKEVNLNGMSFVAPSKYLSIPELEREYNRTIAAFYGQWRVRRECASILLGNAEACRRLIRVAPAALLSFVIRHSSFVIRHSSFVIRQREEHNE